MTGVEAVVEGWVSVMERHCTDVREISSRSRIKKIHDVGGSEWSEAGSL